MTKEMIVSVVSGIVVAVFIAIPGYVFVIKENQSAIKRIEVNLSDIRTELRQDIKGMGKELRAEDRAIRELIYNQARQAGNNTGAGLTALIAANLFAQRAMLTEDESLKKLQKLNPQQVASVAKILQQTYAGSDTSSFTTDQTAVIAQKPAGARSPASLSPTDANREELADYGLDDRDLQALSAIAFPRDL